MRRSALVFAATLSILASGTALGATRPASTGILVKIAIIPPKGEDAKKSPLGTMADVINKDFPLYSVWVVGSGYCPLPTGQQCSPVDATVLIRAMPAGTQSHYDLTAIDIVDGGVIANVKDVDLSGTPKDSDVSPLLGTPAVVGNAIVLNRGYQQYLQIVQAPTSNKDVDYAPVIAELLARRGVTAVRSSFTSAQLGSSPGSVICSSGERYFVYSVSMTSNSNFITGESRVGASAGAFIADCASRTTIPFGGQDAVWLPTTSASLAAYVTLLSLGFPHWLKWTSITQGALAFSKIVDVDPTSYIIRDDVATVALQRGIDQMCQRLDIVAQLREQGGFPSGFPPPKPVKELVGFDQFTPFSFPTPSPPLAKSAQVTVKLVTPKPTKSPKPPRHGTQPLTRANPGGATGGNQGAATSGTQSATASSNPLDLTSFVGPSPPPLQCNPTKPTTVLALPPPSPTPDP
ncbi:MAG TPA: hypothetical protein VIW73_00945 [Candidatus Cybelea sp.]